jgi:hypothetical protein
MTSGGNISATILAANTGTGKASCWRQDQPAPHWYGFPRLPAVEANAVNGRCFVEPQVRVSNDPHCLATLKNHRSLMPLSQEAHKPMFHLRAADGALGGHATAVTPPKELFKLRA